MTDFAVSGIIVSFWDFRLRARKRKALKRVAKSKSLTADIGPFRDFLVTGLRASSLLESELNCIVCQYFILTYACTVFLFFIRVFRVIKKVFIALV